MSIRFERVDDSFYRAYRDGRLIALLQKNPWYKTYPWQIELASGAHFVSKSGHDCFSFTSAKQLVRDEVAQAASR